MVNVGDGLKARRKELNMSIKDTVNALTNYNIKISEKTLYSWESGHRQPDSDVFLILCKIYEIQNVLHYFGFLPKKTTGEFSKAEKELINKYRSLDEQGKFFILTMLDAQLKSMKFGTNSKNNDKIS